jgi:hypothetical protein
MLNWSGRDESGAAFMGCAAEGCNAMPLGPGGAPITVQDRRWWCDRHRDQAGEHDHLPLDDVARIGPNFELIPAPSEQRAMAAKDEQRRREHERRLQERAAEAEARQRYEEAVAEDDYARPLIANIRGARMDPR